MHFALLQLAGGFSGNNPIQREDHNNKYESTVGYNFRRFQGWSTNVIFKWKPRFSPFRITYQFWIWPIPSYVKEPPCTLRTPSTCRWFSVETIQNSVKTKTENMHVRLGIILEIFKGGRQIYIQMKAYVLHFQNSILILNLANSFIPLRASVCTSHSFNLPVFSVETIQYSVKKNIYAYTVGYNISNVQGWPIYLYWNDSLGSAPFRITYQFWIWPIPSYLKEPSSALRTPSTCLCSQWKLYNTAERL